MLELAQFNGGRVQVLSPSFGDLKDKFTVNDQILPTQGVSETHLEVKVNLQGFSKQFSVDWIDATGEAWRPNSLWIRDNPHDWSSLVSTLQSAQAVMVLIAPHQKHLKENLLVQAGNISGKDERFRTPIQWKNRFKEWLLFLHDKCRHTRQVVICLNMADLFCNIEQHSQSLDSLLRRGWYEYKEDTLQNYFPEVIDWIDQYDRSRPIPSQLFITTSKNRTMLEAPWLYLGTYL